MKAVPIQGLVVEKPIEVVIRAFSNKLLNTIFNMEELNDDSEYEIYIDSITFVNKKDLPLYLDSNEVEQIIKKFKDIKTFALISSKPNLNFEFYDLRVALSMIYIAYRMKMEYDYSCFWIENKHIEDKYNFFKSFVSNGYHTKNGYIQSTYWDVKIGINPIDENDFDVTVPVYYSLDDSPESWRFREYQNRSLDISEDISEQMQKICLAIIKNNEISGKLRAALQILYHTLPSENMDVVVIMYATILETLLLSKNEDNQRKKVAVRSACLLQSGEEFGAKEYIASWIYRFYKFRNAIIHDGKNHAELRIEENIMYTFGIPLIKHIIFNLIKELILNEINTVNEIKRIVTDNVEKDGLKNGFDYINEEQLTLMYEK